MRESEPDGHRQAQENRSIGQRDAQDRPPRSAHHHPNDCHQHHYKTRDGGCHERLFDAIHCHRSPSSSQGSLIAYEPRRIRVCESTPSICLAAPNLPHRCAEIAAPWPYDLAVPGSAILRCCLASISFGVTFATVVWILFLSPVTISASRKWHWQGHGRLLMSTHLDRPPAPLPDATTLLQGNEGVIIGLETR
jgi:hypothetical protein